jgi:uncharacterized protein YutE (UPF0331/DUF86 family)
VQEDNPTIFSPLMHEAGLALLECQKFEYGLGLLVFLLNRLGVLILTPKQEIELIQNADERTAGQLLKPLQTVVTWEPALEKSLKTGLRVRNIIVHRFFNVNIHRLFDPATRAQVLDDLRILREAIKEACADLNEIIKVAYKRFDGTDIDAIYQEHRKLLEEQESASLQLDEEN